jgi:hypothetical protein
VKNLEEVMAVAMPRSSLLPSSRSAGVYKKHGEFQKAIDVLKQLEAAGTYSKSAVAL